MSQPCSSNPGMPRDPSEPAGGSTSGSAGDPRLFVYRIDAEDRLIYANDAWFEFALENHAACLSTRTVVGRPLWEYISQRETQVVFESLIRRVRAGGRTILLPYRCDSPTERRFMELRLQPLPNHQIEFQSRILRTEKREAVALLDHAAERSDHFLRMCSWCKKVHAGTRGWLEVEEAVAELQLFAHQAMPRITHGICEVCSRLLLPAPPPSPGGPLAA